MKGRTAKDPKSRMRFGSVTAVLVWVAAAGGAWALSYSEKTWNVEVVAQTGGRAQGVGVHGSYAYFCEGRKLAILDVTVPSSPTLCGWFIAPFDLNYRPESDLAIGAVRVVDATACVAALSIEPKRQNGTNGRM